MSWPRESRWRRSCGRDDRGRLLLAAGSGAALLTAYGGVLTAVGGAGGGGRDPRGANRRLDGAAVTRVLLGPVFPPPGHPARRRGVVGTVTEPWSPIHRRSR